MSNNSNGTTNNTDSFFGRVVANEALRKGIAGAIAGALVAAVSEALWPSR